MNKLIITALLAVAAVVPAEAKGFYVSTSFGLNQDGESNLPFVSEDTGLVGSVALGTHVDGVTGLRFELEASYRTHDSTAFGFLTMEHDTTAVMANLAWDIEALSMGRVVPFIMAGAGMAHTELTFAGLAPLTVENDGFAFQLGTGLNYRISDSVTAGLQYRYLEAPAVEIFGFELDAGSNHAAMATVSIALN